MANRCHVRSISLPTRSHPTILKIQKELNKLRSWETSSRSMSETICTGLSGLEELQKSLDELLSLPSSQQALSHHLNEKWVDELLDGSVRLLDICGSTRDAISQLKQNARDLQSALRRRKGDVCIESSIGNYICSRKKMNKDAKKLLAAMKKMDKETRASPLLDQHHQLSAVIEVLGEVNAISISIFQALLLFLSAPVSKPKPTRWSLVSKFVHKGIVKHENIKELESVDFILSAISGGRADLEKMQIAHKELETLEASIEGLENGLECMFRRLIKTRASLLNIVSH
ncbi:hypothetical protein CK203_066550 [Vitis vinifera]|uniref:DUF241 domain protein n=1 Tax=Vitis vinifera TaxID=29760 RepID=A0A438EV58_VITVI|nr:hypothetical protein CK203_066550 [Vitis vinifera]